MSLVVFTNLAYMDIQKKCCIHMETDRAWSDLEPFPWLFVQLYFPICDGSILMFDAEIPMFHDEILN